MNTRFVWSTGTAAVLALGLTAQAQTPPPPSQPDRPKDTMYQSDDRQKEITLTGCVQKADMTSSSPSGSTSPGGTPSTSAPSGSDDAKYILTSASMSSGTSGATGTTGSTAGSTGSSASGTTYKLKGEEEDLAKFVGQRVEVRGRLDDKMSGSSTGSTASGSSASGSADKVLKVSSVRQMSGSCGESR
ncbi:MAG TPA: hypothetical protein VHI98_24170 [Vicinamibacterales bacterium]|nr:hypothetical protein [Vicinamibacterales bacterium]